MRNFWSLLCVSRTFYAPQTKILEDGTKERSVYFRGTLRWLVAQIEYSHPHKVPRTCTPDPLFRLPKSSFGEHTIAHATMKCMPPNKDIGIHKSESGVHFRAPLRWFVAQIEYSNRRKVHQKCRPDLLLCLPRLASEQQSPPKLSTHWQCCEQKKSRTFGPRAKRA